ncbi:MAG: hypothetical protein Q9184_004293 [Pyrenodesmia sp. 2 TL-2023]
MTVIEERTGDIFNSPAHSILIRNALPFLPLTLSPQLITSPADACNAKGSWGRGVAAAFKSYSPTAYAFQYAHCTQSPSPSTPLSTHQRNLVGTCLLIPPFPALASPSPPTSTSKIKTTKTPKPPPSPTAAQQEKQFWIACLFTSHGFGKSVDTADKILQATKRSVQDLGRQIEAHRAREVKGEKVEAMAGCVSVRINSGLFGVDWARTREVLEEVGVGMVVVRPEENGEGNGGGEKDGRGKTVGDKAKKKKMDGVKEKATASVNAKGTAGAKRKGPAEDVDGGGGKRQTRLRF